MNTFLITWAIVGIIILSVLCYAIGRGLDDNDSDEKPGIIVVSVVISIFWPIVLAIGMFIAPFYIPYKLGRRHREIDKNKQKMWKTLKQ